MKRVENILERKRHLVWVSMKSRISTCRKKNVGSKKLKEVLR